ncbi:M13 family metallopeptidase [Nocardia brasiliensis]|uniref:M13 family metallopeptidase n=1 Tax=Nocardia brasiliensis TaxID=37326 RepID=UPI002456D9F3|nr:M13 family metallopeptidase [Nocardia brasiliensis]
MNRRGFLSAIGLAVVGSSVSSSANSAIGNGGPGGTRPQDDLYRFVNGEWLDSYQLPPDKTSQSSGEELAQQIRLQLQQLVDAIRDPLPGSIEQKIRDLYDAQLDIETRNRLGLGPIQDMLDAIASAGTKHQLAGVMASASKELPVGKTQVMMGGLIGLQVVAGNETYQPIICQSGIRFDKSFYASTHQARQRKSYEHFLGRIATAAGLSDGIRRAESMLDLESRIARLHWDRTLTRSATATRNVMRYEQVVDSSPGFDWMEWAAALTGPGILDRVVVAQPSFLAAAGALWSEVGVAEWQNYLTLGAIRDYCIYLGNPFADFAFDFFGRNLSGVVESPSGIASAVETVDRFLGDALGRKYVEAHFSEQARSNVKDMVENIKEAYRDNFSKSSWMAESTKTFAIKKLDSMSARIGYPDVWPAQDGYHVARGCLIESIRNISTFECARAVASMYEPVDSSVWSIPPHRVEASYSRQRNQITFPAAVLQPPYYDSARAEACNYGSVGSIIAHEIGHGFDDQGANYDAAGELEDWWTAQDRAAFDQKTRAVVEQYNRLRVITSGREQRVDGVTTVGENIADLQGLAMALKAYLMVVRKRGGGRGDLAAFFVSYARRWRQKIRPDIAETATATGVHAPAEVRVNQVVRNMPEFYAAFDVRSADRLYLPASERVCF